MKIGFVSDRQVTVIGLIISTSVGVAGFVHHDTELTWISGLFAGMSIMFAGTMSALTGLRDTCMMMKNHYEEEITRLREFIHNDVP